MNKLALALGLFCSAVAAEYTTTLLFVGLVPDSQAIGGYVGRIIGTVCSPTAPIPSPYILYLHYAPL